MANTIYDFVWNEFCDWYPEIAKVQIQNGTQSAATRHAPHADPHAGNHPAPGAPHHPFITEALWQVVAPVAGPRASRSALPATPKPSQRKIDEAAIAHMGRVKGRGGRLPYAARRDERLARHPPARLFVVGDAEFMRGVAPVLPVALAKLSEVKVFDDEADGAPPQAAPVAVVGEPACACSWRSTWRPRRPACPRKSRASKARSPRPTANCPTKPSSPRPRRRAGPGENA